MKCPLCKANMEAGKTNMPYDLEEGGVVVVKDVPALVCQQCGDVFIELKVTRQLEEIVSTAKQDGMTLGFVSYEKAA